MSRSSRFIHPGDTSASPPIAGLGTPPDPNDEPVQHITHDPDTGLPWPDPSVPEPEFLTLAQFLFDAVSEATDGCLVKPDGFCPHGHPSWLRRLGVV